VIVIQHVSILFIFNSQKSKLEKNAAHFSILEEMKFPQPQKTTGFL